MIVKPLSPLWRLPALEVRARIAGNRWMVPGVLVGRSYSCRAGPPSEQQTHDAAPKSVIWTVPNILTMSRIACAPFIGHCIMTQQLMPAFCLFAYSCVTDFLDGYLARKYKSRTVAGTILDPMADKLLMIVTTAGLTLPTGPQLIPLPIASLILGRDGLLALSAIYYRYASMRAVYGKVTWGTYCDFFRYPSAEVKPTLISKWNTFLQMVYLGCGLVVLALGPDEARPETEGEGDPWWRRAYRYLGYVVGATTVLSGASYIFSKSAVKYLKPQGPRP
ncbi:ADR084Cp [Eremothecium gossypii ATCC 10895]|uniref:ADR084Cp n=1 Tax=Eremothecium gossypii (strain ATCC 10895 / CBS 109.51 / FGSC 9923 / NRRL Y-1056) TaxID=284811 RepID=Q75A35_EREGS|nr:ADR084Cp [Eremothecium gossypii ATCC 10895]AAS52004.2 ADR084Cp [Eremothecium gossypii ATCC 10895]AEY96303.1 FADR084Cp [Eremothecium gossypii FDAG1]